MHESNNVEFMGVLVDRQYISSQRCAQLVFETAEGIRLSLSRNVNMVRSLTLGLTYRVSGAERTVGKKRYIHEPSATLVPVTTTPFFKRYKLLIPVAVSMAVIIGGVGTYAFASSRGTTSDQPTTSVQKPAAKSITKDTTPVSATVTQPASEAASSSSAQQQAATTAVPSTKKTSSSAAKTAAPSASVVTPAVAPQTTNDPVTQVETPAVTTPVEEVPVDTPAPVEPTTPEPIATQ